MIVPLRKYKVALAGNPNTGKSTVFNTLTGLKQHTGNWPGKTVARAEGFFSFNEHNFKLIDLPGTYSLLSNSPEEEIARNFVLFSNPDVNIIVVDATSLERNLNLVLQILEISRKSVICLNLVDEAKRKGIHIDSKALSVELGVPVVETIAIRKKGINELMSEVDKVATSQPKKPIKLKLEGNLKKIVEQVKKIILKNINPHQTTTG